MNRARDLARVLRLALPEALEVWLLVVCLAGLFELPGERRKRSTDSLVLVLVLDPVRVSLSARQSVNQGFADAIQEVYEEGDLIWVHDYHLTMLPQMLRNVLPGAKIGFFLHLPFPSSEVSGHGRCSAWPR